MNRTSSARSLSLNAAEVRRTPRRWRVGQSRAHFRQVLVRRPCGAFSCAPFSIRELVSSPFACYLEHDHRMNASPQQTTAERYQWIGIIWLLSALLSAIAVYSGYRLYLKSDSGYDLTFTFAR